MPIQPVHPPLVPVGGENIPSPQQSRSSLDQHPRSEPSPSFRDVFIQVARSVDQGEATVSAALRVPGDASEDRQMLALQAGVYRYVEAVELCSRLVDRATNAVKTTLQSQ